MRGLKIRPHAVMSLHQTCMHDSRCMTISTLAVPISSVLSNDWLNVVTIYFVTIIIIIILFTSHAALSFSRDGTWLAAGYSDPWATVGLFHSPTAQVRACVSRQTYRLREEADSFLSVCMWVYTVLESCSHDFVTACVSMQCSSLLRALLLFSIHWPCLGVLLFVGHHLHCSSHFIAVLMAAAYTPCHVCCCIAVFFFCCSQWWDAAAVLSTQTGPGPIAALQFVGASVYH